MRRLLKNNVTSSCQAQTAEICSAWGIAPSRSEKIRSPVESIRKYHKGINHDKLFISPEGATIRRPLGPHGNVHVSGVSTRFLCTLVRATSVCTYVLTPLKWIVGFIFTLCIATTANANPGPEEEAQFASVMVEARFYKEAFNRYQELLGKDLETWQRNIVLFNLATVSLKMQRWEQAIDRLGAVTFDAEDSPQFLRRYWYNTALAHYGLARQHSLSLATDAEAAEELVDKQEHNLLFALGALSVSEQAACRLAEIEGAEECYESEDVTALRVACKSLMAQLSEQKLRLTLEQQTPRVLAARLSVLLAASHREVEDALPEASELVYTRLVALQPYWEALQETLPSNSIQDEILDWAYTQYQEAMENTADLAPALLLLENAQDAIEAILEIRLGRAPAAALLDSKAESVSKIPAALIRKALKETAPLPSRRQYWETLQNQLGDSTLAQSAPIDALGLYQLALGKDVDIIARIWEGWRHNKLDPKALEVLKAQPLSNSGRQLLQMFQQPYNPDASQEALWNVVADSGPQRWLELWLRLLSRDYLLALAHRKLENTALQGFTTELVRLNHFLELLEEGKMASETHDQIAEQLELVKTSHEQGVLALEASYPKVAGIFFSDAQHRTQILVSGVLASDKAPVESALQEAVAEQAHALKVVDATMNLPQDQRQAAFSFAQPVHELMRLTQSEALEQIPTFIRAVHKMQKHLYRPGVSIKCLRQPWEQALPLVFVGESAAQRASGQLSEAQSELSGIQDEQKVAYKKWRQALEKLRESHIAAQQRQQLQDSTTEEEQSLQDVLRLLQHMHLTDQWDEPQPQQVQQEGRPW